MESNLKNKMDYLRTEIILRELFKEHASIIDFLDTIFRFLRRNTDFYYTNKDGDEKKIEIEQDVRQRVVISAMQRYSPVYHHLRLTSNDQTPPALAEIEVETAADSVQIESVRDMRCVKDFFGPSDYKNGALSADYCWSQTLKDVELHVRLPPDLLNSKMVVIEIKADSISVQQRVHPATVIISGQLSNKCKHTDAIWTISDQQKLTINLDKAKEIWWEKLFQHDSDTIDIKKLNTECFIDELPDESQVVINQLRVHQIMNPGAGAHLLQSVSPS